MEDKIELTEENKELFLGIVTLMFVQPFSEDLSDVDLNSKDSINNKLKELGKKYKPQLDELKRIYNEKGSDGIQEALSSVERQ